MDTDGHGFFEGGRPGEKHESEPARAGDFGVLVFLVRVNQC